MYFIWNINCKGGKNSLYRHLQLSFKVYFSFLHVLKLKYNCSSRLKFNWSSNLLFFSVEVSLVKTFGRWLQSSCSLRRLPIALSQQVRHSQLWKDLAISSRKTSKSCNKIFRPCGDREADLDPDHARVVAGGKVTLFVETLWHRYQGRGDPDFFPHIIVLTELTWDGKPFSQQIRWHSSLSCTEQSGDSRYCRMSSSFNNKAVIQK